MSNVRPLQYKQFINSLIMMGMCIPALPTKSGEAFMVFERGGEGYFPKPAGARYTLVHRDNDELVPVLEVEKAILHLGFSPDVFWEITDHTTPKPPKTDEAPKISSSGPSSD